MRSGRSSARSSTIWRVARRKPRDHKDAMSAVQLIALASTVSLLAGWRLYLVTFAVGLAMHFGWIALPQQLHALDVLANWWIIGIAAVGTLAEFFADKIAWVDSLWD